MWRSVCEREREWMHVHFRGSPHFFDESASLLVSYVLCVCVCVCVCACVYVLNMYCILIPPNFCNMMARH